MSTVASPELRAEVIASIKEGTTIAAAAEAHGLKPKTVAKWMTQSNKGANAQTTETQKLRKEIEFLKSVILDLVLEKKAAMRKG